MSLKPTHFFLLFLLPLFAFPQETMLPPQNVDSLYREDQIYFGITVNFLNERPNGVVTESFVGGLSFGFLRDMPINKRRNIAIAAGLGYAYNSYGHNLFVGSDENNQTAFIVLDDNFDYNKNRFETHEIELPIEFRWRTSTPTEYKFWRVYTGLKLGYAFYFKTIYREDGIKIRNRKIDEFERLRYTAFLNFGYNTINFQVQYNINSFFNKNAQVNDESIHMTAIKIGIMFYLL